MPERHGKACVTRWRQRAERNGWSQQRLVSELTACCNISRLRAHRLLRGWTLPQAAQELRALASAHGDGVRADGDQLRAWETRPYRPRPTTIDLLCRLYQTHTQDLGLEAAGDYRSVPGSTAGTAPSPAANGQVTAHSAQRGDWLEDLRHAVDRTLAATSVTPGQLDLLDEWVMQHRRQYLVSPPRLMLQELAADLREVQWLASHRQPASVQLRLSEMTAVLATLIGDAHMKLGELRRARSWYATGLTAADDSGHRGLRARVRAQAAMLPYYYGPLHDAVRFAHEARLLVQHRPSNTGVFAAAAEARARARAGDRAGAEGALRAAQELFSCSEVGSDFDAWTFPERRLLLYTSGTLTYIGQTQRARRVQHQAQESYRNLRGSIDPALLSIEQALCLLQEHRLSEAFQLAGAAYLEVPAEHRTEILGARARDVVDAAPDRMRATRHARELTDLLALPPGGSTALARS